MRGQRHREATGRRGRVWRTASLSAVTAAVAIAIGGAGVRADEPAAPEEVSEVTVEVGLPPVPPTYVTPEAVDEVTVEVGLPPVPPTYVAPEVVDEVTVEVGLPPVPPLPDTGGDDLGDEGGDPVVDVTSSIAGTVAATASAAWRSA